MLVLRRYRSLLIASLLVLPTLLFAAPAQADRAEIRDLGLVDPLLPDLTDADDVRLVVGHDGAVPQTVESLVARSGGTLVRTDAALGFSVIEVPAPTAQAFQESARLVRDVHYVKEDVPVQALFTPDDPRYPDQWGPQAIGIESVWDTTLGDHGIEVAVIDTGTDYTHTDLAANVCRTGPDYVNDDSDPMDDHYHGTHVAGTVAAVIDNAEGVAGMGNVCVVPIKVLNGGGSGTFSDVASGIQWAADNGIEIISMSLGGCCDPGPPVTTAIQNAADAGVLIVAAAGNSGCGPVGYPAAYPEIVAVGSLDEPGNSPSSFSSCGPEVEVAAPGRDIVSTVPTSIEPSGYASLSGTSMATPHVSGVAALFWGQHPNLTADEVRCVLAQNSVDLLQGGRDDMTGFGRIDVPALFATPTCVPEPPLAPDLHGRSGDLAAALDWTRPFAWGGVDGYRVYRGTDASDLTLLANVTSSSYVDPGLTAGATYHYAVEAYNAAGTGPRSDPVQVTVRAALTLPHTLDFESGFADWTPTGLWHTTTDRAASGQSAYFGLENGPGLDDNSYDTGRAESGVIESPPIRLPSGASSLTFWQYHDLEDWFSEHPIIQIATEDAPSDWQETWSMGSYFPYEGAGAVDLSAYADQVVYLRFVVDANSWQSYEGWYVDNLSIVAEAAPELPPVSQVVFPTEDEPHWPAAHPAAGVYTDPNGDADVVNATIRIDGGAAQGVEITGRYWHGTYGPLATGLHALEATIRDTGGLEASAASTFHVDAETPTLQVSSPAEGTSVPCSFTIRGSAADTGGSGLAYVYVDWRTADDEGLWPIQWHTFDGENDATWDLPVDISNVVGEPVELVLRLYDQAGNRNVTTWTVVRDGTDCRPHIELTEPTDGATVTCVLRVRGTVTSPIGRNLSFIRIDLDGSFQRYEAIHGDNSFDTTIGIGNREVGNHTLTVRAYDAKYVENATTVTVQRVASDCLPRLVIDAPADGAAAGCSVVVRGTATSPRGPVAMDVFTVIGSQWYGMSEVGEDGTWSMEVGLGALQPGEYVLKVHVVDQDGIWNESAPQTLVRDTTDCRPSVTITSPSGPADAGCSLIIKGTAQGRDGAGLTRVRVYADDHEQIGSAYLGLENQVAWTVEAHLGDLHVGEHTLKAIVTDENGATNESAPLTIERLAVECDPVLAVTTPSPDATVGGTVSIAGTVVWPENGTGEVWAYAGGNFLGWREMTDGAWAFTWNTFGLENGTYWIDVLARSYGNFSSGDRVSFQVEVVNERIQRIVSEEFAGTIGCAVTAGPIKTRDLCTGEGLHGSSVDPGLTAARVVLQWTSDLPADLETLSVDLIIGTEVFTAEGVRGSDEVVLYVELEEMTTRGTDTTVSVRASDDGVAGVADETPYTVQVDWAYFGATI